MRLIQCVLWVFLSSFVACEHGRYLRVDLKRAEAGLASDQHEKLKECFLTVASEFRMELLPEQQGAGQTFEFDLTAVHAGAGTGFSMKYLAHRDTAQIVFRQGTANGDFSVAIAAWRRLREEMDRRGFVSKERLEDDGFIYSTSRKELWR